MEFGSQFGSTSLGRFPFNFSRWYHSLQLIGQFNGIWSKYACHAEYKHCLVFSRMLTVCFEIFNVIHLFLIGRSIHRNIFSREEWV